MKKGNIRYGVVNTKVREEYEKKWQLPHGYILVTYDRKAAIKFCKSLKNNEFIVEEIYDTAIASNMKEEIFRGE